MKFQIFLIAAFVSPALFCHAQDKAPADKPAVHDAAAQPAQDATSPAVDNSYVIGPNDDISIFVWKEPDLSTGAGRDVTVRPDGMISMPLLGDVKAVGLTTLQLAAEITDGLKKYIQDPNVTVVLVTTHSKQVHLIGEIARPGSLYMTPGMTVLQAIADSGGLTQYANSKKIYILRNEGGKQQKIAVQYKQALKGDLSLNLSLNPDDTIVVP